MSAVESHFADLDEVSIHYLKAGKGDPAVLLHGIPQTSHEWRHVIPRLTGRYAVIAPDLRGLGDSSRPFGGYDKKTVANDIWQLLRGKLEIDRFFLAGHDWGGPVAFSLAAQHPDAVRRLAILDVAIPGDGADFSQGGRRWHHAFFRTRDLPEALCFGRERLILGWLFENYGYRPNAIPPEDQDEYFRTYTKFGAADAHVADGLENPLAGIYFAKMQEVQKYLSWTNHMGDGFWFLANRRSFDALLSSARDIIVKNVNDAALKQRADVERLNNDLESQLSKTLEFIDVDSELFRRKLQDSPFYSEWKRRFGDNAWALPESFSGKLA